MQREIGLHLRLRQSLREVAEKARAFELPVAQCFLLKQGANRFVEPTARDIQQFSMLRRQGVKRLFAHGSYWTNLASIHDISLRAVKHEIRLAKKLSFDAIIFHPGSAKGAADKMAGIDALVRRLNRLLRYERESMLVLENTAHGALSIGGDLNDFKIILEKIDYPEKISFCIDTAHAHVYGYAIDHSEGQQQFLAEIERTIGFERITLLHLNNTNQQRGSCIDRHTLLTQGLITPEALKSFIMHPQLRTIPIIMELPEVAPEIEKEHITLVRAWHQ